MRFRYLFTLLLLAAISAVFLFYPFSLLGRALSSVSFVANQITGSTSTTTPFIPSSTTDPLPEMTLLKPCSIDCISSEWTKVGSSQPISASTTNSKLEFEPTITSSATPPVKTPSTLHADSNTQPLKQHDWLKSFTEAARTDLRRGIRYGLLVLLVILLVPHPGWVGKRHLINHHLAKIANKNDSKTPTNISKPPNRSTAPTDTNVIDKDIALRTANAQLAKFIHRDDQEKQGRRYLVSKGKDISVEGISKEDFVRVAEKERVEKSRTEQRNTTLEAENASLRRQLKDAKNAPKTLHDSFMEDGESRQIRQLKEEVAHLKAQLKQNDIDHQKELNILQDKINEQDRELTLRSGKITQQDVIVAQFQHGVEEVRQEVAQLIVALLHINLNVRYNLIPTLRNLLPALPLDQFVPALVDCSTQFPHFTFVLNTFLPSYKFRCPCGSSPDTPMAGLQNQLASIYSGPNHIAPTYGPSYSSSFGNDMANRCYGAAGHVDPCNIFGNGQLPIGNNISQGTSSSGYRFPPITDLDKISDSTDTASSAGGILSWDANLGNSAADTHRGFSNPATSTTRPIPDAPALSSCNPTDFSNSTTLTPRSLADAPALSSDDTTDEEKKITAGLHSALALLTAQNARNALVNPPPHASVSIFSKQQHVNPLGTPSVPSFGSQIPGLDSLGTTAAGNSSTSMKPLTASTSDGFGNGLIHGKAANNNPTIASTSEGTSPAAAHNTRPSPTDILKARVAAQKAATNLPSKNTPQRPSQPAPAATRAPSAAQLNTNFSIVGYVSLGSTIPTGPTSNKPVPSDGAPLPGRAGYVKAASGNSYSSFSVSLTTTTPPTSPQLSQASPSTSISAPNSTTTGSYSSQPSQTPRSNSSTTPRASSQSPQTSISASISHTTAAPQQSSKRPCTQALTPQTPSPPASDSQGRKKATIGTKFTTPIALLRAVPEFTAEQLAQITAQMQEFGAIILPDDDDSWLDGVGDTPKPPAFDMGPTAGASGSVGNGDATVSGSSKRSRTEWAMVLGMVDTLAACLYCPLH